MQEQSSSNDAKLRYKIFKHSKSDQGPHHRIHLRARS